MAQPQGPSQPTLIERLIGILPLPFAWAAATWAVVLGYIFPLLASYFGVGNFDSAFRVYAFCGAECSPLQLGSAVANAFPFFFLPPMMTRRMRMRLVREEPILSSISSNGQLGFESDFEATSRKLPQVILMVLVTAGFVLASFSSGHLAVLELAYTAPQLFAVLGLSSFIWTYFAGLRGVNRFGRLRVLLRDPAADATQGTKPLGSITLSLTASYFVVVAAGLQWAIGSVNPFSTLMLGALTMIGASMFFLPLNSLHQKMILNKDAALRRARDQLNDLARKAGQSSPENGDEAAVGVWKLIGTDILEKRISAARTWPFDTSMIGRFVAVVLSVTAALMVAVVRDLLRF